MLVSDKLYFYSFMTSDSATDRTADDAEKRVVEHIKTVKALVTEYRNRDLKINGCFMKWVEEQIFFDYLSVDTEQESIIAGDLLGFLNEGEKNVLYDNRRLRHMSKGFGNNVKRRFYRGIYRVNKHFGIW